MHEQNMDCTVLLHCTVGVKPNTITFVWFEKTNIVEADFSKSTKTVTLLVPTDRG